MTIPEIHKALDEGKTVYWATLLYEVVRHRDELMVVCTENNYTTGLQPKEEARCFTTKHAE